MNNHVKIGNKIRDGEPIKLNLGSGDRTLDSSFLNCDIRPIDNVDIVCDTKKLPVDDNLVDEIYAIDHLEHFDRTAAEDILLEWHRALKPGGRLTLQTPNMQTLATMIVDNSEDIDKVIRWIFGGQDYPGNYHFNGFTPASMYSLLEKVGFDFIHIESFADHYTAIAKPNEQYVGSNMMAFCEKKIPSAVKDISRRKILVWYKKHDFLTFTKSMIPELEKCYDVTELGDGHPIQIADVLQNQDEFKFLLMIDMGGSGWFIDKQIAELHIPCIGMFMDTHANPQGHQEMAKYFDYKFYIFKAAERWIGKKNSALFPMHCDHKIFKPLHTKERYDIGFVGRVHERLKILHEATKNHTIKVRTATTYAPNNMREEANKIMNECSMLFNRHVQDDLNLRVFESLAAGKLLITDRKDNGQEAYFEDRKHLCYYSNVKELEDLICYYAGHPKERNDIARAGHMEFLKHHTTEKRMEQIIDKVENVLLRIKYLK